MATIARDVLHQYALVVEEIRAALQSGSEPDWNLLYEAAAEYAAACDAVNERLRRCKELLRQGLRSEALQEAERDPPLLEACAALDFPELPQWRAALASARMPLPLPLQMDLAAKLNAAYAAQTPLEGMLQRIRLAALCRAPLRVRIDLLAQLAAADRDNPIWTQDLKELELARQQEIRNELSAALAAGDLPHVQSLVREYADGPWKSPPPATAVAEAQAALRRLTVQHAQSRLEEIAQRLEAAYCALDEAAGYAAADEWKQTSRRAELPASAPLHARVAPALQWVAQQRAHQQQQQALAQAAAALAAALDRGAGLRELEALSAQVWQLQGQEDPAVAELLPRCAQRMEALRRASRRRWVLAAVAGGVVLALTVVWMVRQMQFHARQREAHAEAQALAQLITQEQWKTAEERLDAVKRRRPELWAHAVVQEQAARLHRHQQQEHERKDTFTRLVETVEQADPQHADRRLLQEAEALARSPAEHERVAQVRARWEEHARVPQQQHQRRFDEAFSPLLAGTEALERRLAAGDPVDASDLGRLRSQLGALDPSTEPLTAAQREQLQGLRARLTAIEQQSDQLRSRLAGLARVTQAVGQTPRFVQALRELVDQHPTQPGAPQMRRVVHEEAGWWMEVEAWRTILRDPAWTQLGTLSSLQALRLLATVQPLLGPEQTAPPTRWVHVKVPVLHAIAQREDEQGLPRSRQLAMQFRAPWMRDLWILRTEGGNPPKERTYYLTERDKIEPNQSTGLLSIDYVVDTRLATNRVTRNEQMKMLRPAPQAALAQQVEEHVLPKLREGTWEIALWELVEQILDQQEVDPVLRYLLLVEVVEFGGQTSFSFQEALQPLKQLLDDAPVDRTVNWLLPDDVSAERARKNALRLFQTLQEKRTQWRNALQEKLKEHWAPLPPMPQWVGWLAMEPVAEAETYHCHTPQPLAEDGILWVLAPPQPSAADSPHAVQVEWVNIGTVRQGTITWSASARPFLQAGRPVYWVASIAPPVATPPQP